MSKQKILIVDDDNNIAELISLYLTKECYDTKIVNDGEEALHAFEHYNPNLILLDLMLPGIDGYQVCREIRTKSNVPIIMLSAKGEIFDKVLGLELGADDYIAELKNIYKDSVIVQLADAIVGVFEDSEAIADGFSYARYFSQKEINSKWKKDSLVKLGEKLMKEKAMQDFHKIVLDTDYRSSLLRK